MEIKIYQVDAFTNKVFGGNPAAVCPLEEWLPDSVMQNIAMENCLAETAFYVNEKEGLRIRWFAHPMVYAYSRSRFVRARHPGHRFYFVQP